MKGSVSEHLSLHSKSVQFLLLQYHIYRKINIAFGDISCSFTDVNYLKYLQKLKIFEPHKYYGNFNDL